MLIDRLILGITLLVSLNNDDFNIFYDWNGQDVNIDLIHAKMRKLQGQGYSAQLIKTLKMMLEKDEYKRIGLSELLRQANRGTEPQYNDYNRGYSTPYANAYPAQANQYAGGYQDYQQQPNYAANGYSNSPYNYGNYASQQPYSNSNNGYPSAQEPQKAYGNFLSKLFDPKPQPTAHSGYQENPRTYRDKPAVNCFRIEQQQNRNAVNQYSQQASQSTRGMPSGVSFPTYQSYRSPYAGQPEVGSEPQTPNQQQNWFSKWA